jgi:hypothetical protein
MTTQKKQSLCCWEGLFTDPLPSNERPIVAHVGSHGSVFTESLPTDGSMRHNIITDMQTIWIHVASFYVNFHQLVFYAFLIQIYRISNYFHGAKTFLRRQQLLHWSRNWSAFYRTWNFISLFIRVPHIGPTFKSDESIPHPCICLFKIHFNIYPSILRSCTWSFRRTPTVLPEIVRSFPQLLQAHADRVLLSFHNTPWRRMGDWMYRSTFSSPQHWMEVSG